MSRYNLAAHINIASLHKGDVIPQATIEAVCGVTLEHNYQTFKLAQMCIAQSIGEELEAIGNVWTVRCRGGDVCVLTDSQASKYNANAHRYGLRKAKRSHRRAVHVDVSNLSESERIAHDRELIRQGRVQTAVQASLRGQPIVVPSVKSERHNPIGEGRRRTKSAD